MKKLFIALFSFSFIAMFTVHTQLVKAAEDFEKYYYDIGYKDISTALVESNKHFHKNISLPSELPAIPFTHAFGRLSDLDGQENDGLEFAFINEDSPHNLYKITINPSEYKLPFEQKNINQKVKLKDGSEAIFSKTFTNFSSLAFEKNGWQYILSVDQASDKEITIENLIGIANSVK
ncbi:hypothetical protein ACWV26_09240 [Rummeliibacillus sp. JY-2-4R]